MINMMMSNICALMRCVDAPFQPHSSSDFKICMEIGTQMENTVFIQHKLTEKFKSIRCFFVFCLHLPQSMVRSFYSSMLPHAIHFPNCFYRCYHKMYFGRELQNIQLNELLIRIHHRSMFENGIHTDVAFESKTQAI